MKKDYLYEAVIVRVVDGDSVHADVDLGFRMTARLPVRIKNLDTPEIFRPGSEEEKVAGMRAKEDAERLLGHRTGGLVGDVMTMGITRNVVLRTHKDTGKYGRWLADITLSDGRDFATVMRELGHDKG